MTLREYKTVTLLVHVNAGSGTGGKLAAQVVEGVRTLFSHARLEVIETQSKEHIALTGSASKADLILCLTGDGSIHDLAQTLVGRPEDQSPTLAVIPAGSGNDYARTLGMPLDPLKALALLPQCKRIKADVGKVNSTYFIETLSFGVDAAVALNTEELRLTTQARGMRLYARAAVSAILHELNAHEVKIRVDGREFSQNALILAVQNGPTYGSGFKVAPRASITDGMLDVYMASHLGRIGALYYLARLKNGNHEHLKSSTHLVTSQLELEFAEQVPAQCDGERLVGTKFAIGVVPGALDVLVAPDCSACGTTK